MKINDPVRSIYRGLKPINDTGYLTRNLTREAVSFISRHWDKPFFLYLPYNAVHNPLQAPPEAMRLFDTGDKKRDTYLAMLTIMDEGVGEVLDALASAGIEENTLVMFFTDNGGARGTSADNGELRDHKPSVYEGGIRVPFLVRWPGKVPAGQISDEPVISLDAFATTLSAAAVTPPADRPIDGKDIVPALRGESSTPLHDALYWSLIDKDSEEGWAVRRGRWKLLTDKVGKELYDLDADVGEKRNLAADKPELVYCPGGSFSMADTA